VYVSTNNGPYFLKCLFLATSPAAATLTHEVQEERSRLSGTAYGDIKVTIYIGFSIGSKMCTSCLSLTF